MRWARLVLAAVMVLAASQAWADLKAGVEAYERGDYATALTEFRPLAQQGDADAQFIVGAMYDRGEGVPKDQVKAHMWFSLAAAQGYEVARKSRDILAGRMTPAQIATAQRLAREWKPKQ